jgi:hypothetical protein
MATQKLLDLRKTRTGSVEREARWVAVDGTYEALGEQMGRESARMVRDRQNRRAQAVLRRRVMK